MRYHYVWLMWSSALLVPWIALYLASGHLRPVMWRASLATAAFGLTEPIFVPAYWLPPSLFDLTPLGIFTAISVVVCVVSGLIVPPSVHMAAFLELILRAFKWLTLWGFALGLTESCLYGVYAGLVFVPTYNVLFRRWGGAATHQ